MRSPFLTSSFKGFERLSNKLSEFAEVQSSDTSGVHNQDLGTINHPLEWLLRLLNPCMCVSTCSVFAHCSPSLLPLCWLPSCSFHSCLLNTLYLFRLLKAQILLWFLLFHVTSRFLVFQCCYHPSKHPSHYFLKPKPKSYHKST